MNSVSGSIITLLVLLIVASYVLAPTPSKSQSGAPGRYAIAAPGVKNNLWRLDTDTGQVCHFAMGQSGVTSNGCSN